MASEGVEMSKCMCKELRAALMRASLEVEAAVFKLSEYGFCSAKLGYRLREEWAKLIEETGHVKQDQAQDSKATGEGEPVEPHQA